MHARQLVVYRDGETASSVIEVIGEQTETCGPVESVPGITEFRWSARPFDFGGDEGMLLAGGEFTLDSEARGVGRTLIGVVRRGNAVLSVTLSDESSAPVDDLTEPGAAGVVALTTELASRMCVFAADPCRAESPDKAEKRPATEPPPYMIDGQDLAAATGVDGWEVVDDGFGTSMLCAEDSTEALGGDRTTTAPFAVRRGGGIQAMAIATMVDFSTTSYAAQAAPEAFTTVADWLESCDAPLDRKHKVFSAGEAYGQVHSGRSGQRRWSWRTVMSNAPEICVECDAAWNNHQGVTLADDRLVILQVSYRGDMQGSVDETTSPMPKLLEAAAELAANGGPHPDDAEAEAAARSFGPTGFGPIQLGMSAADLAAAGYDPGQQSRPCQGFTVSTPEGSVEGWLSRDQGVVALVARSGAKTPEGVGLGDTRIEVEEAHGELTPSSMRQGWLTEVPGHSGISYSFDFDPDGTVSELALLRVGQDCLE
jgi:hypothetical protein